MTSAWRTCTSKRGTETIPLPLTATATASQTSIYGGRGNDTFIVNDAPLQAPLALFGGLNTFAGDTLTINGDAAGNTFDLTGFTIVSARGRLSVTKSLKN